MTTIQQDIEAFLKNKRVGAATFGALAMNDRHLVRQLRSGRRLWPETEQKIREFMANYEAPATTGEAA